ARGAGRGAGACSRSLRPRAGGSERILQASEGTDLLEAEAAQDRLRGGRRLRDECGHAAPHGLVPARPHERAIRAASARLGERGAAEEEAAALAVRRAAGRDRPAFELAEKVDDPRRRLCEREGVLEVPTAL